MVETKRLIDEMCQRDPRLETCREPLEAAIARTISAFESGQTLFVCGNGGSAADSEHIVGELQKKFALQRRVTPELADSLNNAYDEDGAYLAEHLEPGFRAIALTSHPSLATAMANDVAADLIFAQQLLALGREGDVLIGISTSGNAGNVRHALRLARVMGITTIGLSGETGGAMHELLDIALLTPSTSTPRIQEMHLQLYHCYCEAIEAAFFSPGATKKII